ncbi:Spo0E like sporulation regulatory protein [Paenibacillus sp. 1_12]|uniref:aspartyl-phosphate phosphatase Spo0E family protein n=1 Tax=Paenibacillus sp. 1_12 TaxID=1566278 RepID=UPI0008E60453|nr:aspartyl-phosphate phosphatase Spo0E family protein [Paenibacillus sp. 1_12]SFL83262.1 Spo0E like sporulation regulatory protein [Paenibacillus sp. 1_12]
MNIAAHIEQQILLLNQELHTLVTLKGYELTHSEVVNKSIELDQLIYCAMSSQSKRLQKMHAS